MQVAGLYLTIPAGGGDLVIPGHPEPEIRRSSRRASRAAPSSSAQKAELAVAGGADLLKVIASGAVLAYGGVPGRAGDDAGGDRRGGRGGARHGLKVAAHAHGAQSIREAILAGADTIEHASLIDDEPASRSPGEHQVALSMDVYNGDYIDTEGPQAELARGVPAQEHRDHGGAAPGFHGAHAAGVPIVYGTDAGVYPHGLNARQFPIMVERGMTPMQAIQSATSVAAQYMGWSDRVGTIAPGQVRRRHRGARATRCRTSGAAGRGGRRQGRSRGSVDRGGGLDGHDVEFADMPIFESPLSACLVVLALWLGIGICGVIRPDNLRLIARVLFPLSAMCGAALALIAAASIASPAESLTLVIGLPDLPIHARLDALSGAFLFLLGAATTGISAVRRGLLPQGRGHRARASVPAVPPVPGHHGLRAASRTTPTGSWSRGRRWRFRRISW